MEATEQNTVSITEQPIAKIELHLIYIMAGSGIPIVLLIFGGLIHLFKKSKSLERKLFIQQACENEKNTDSFNKFKKESNRFNNRSEQPCNRNHSDRSVDADYDEINEGLESHITSENYEIPKHNDSLEQDVIQVQDSEDLRICESLSGLYLDPLSEK